MSTILVTGYAGFIGSHLTEKLLYEGYEVVGIDNYNTFYKPEVKKRNVLNFVKNSCFHGYEIDLKDKKAVSEVFDQYSISAVIHLAASAGVRPSMESPVDYASNNITAMVSLLDNMQASNVKKLVFASSSSVYGGIKQTPFFEDMVLDKVMSTYAATKLSGETFNQLYHDSYGFSVINLRFFTVYGPRQRPDLAIHKFCKMIKEGEEITLYGEGKLKRDYTYIQDTIQGVLGGLKRVLNSNVALNETYNLGNNKPVSILELVRKIEEVTNLKARIKFAPTPLGDVPITYASIKKANEILDYLPQTNLHDGLTYFWEWFKTTYYEKDTSH